MGPVFDWPAYSRVSETEEQVAHCRREYKALLSMCDANLGHVLDAFDELGLWRDTMLVVWTDHGFLLGEHGWWAKMRMPWYEELARTPFFVWDPRSGVSGERRAALVQPAIDIAPTLLEYFGQPIPPDMLGKPLRQTIADDVPVHEAGIFGIFGAQVNVTDGRFVYMRATENPDAPLNEYTVMPTYMNCLFGTDALSQATLAPPFPFAKGCPLLKVPVSESAWYADLTKQTLLFDLQNDPGQQSPLDDPETEARMASLLVRLMRECDAPPEQFERLGL
jgi:hypothetical protein